MFKLEIEKERPKKGDGREVICSADSLKDVEHPFDCVEEE